MISFKILKSKLPNYTGLYFVVILKVVLYFFPSYKKLVRFLSHRKYSKLLKILEIDWIL